jgi:hypothetical protein
LGNWEELPLYQPAWWSRPEPHALAGTAPLLKIAAQTRKARKTPPQEMLLFAVAEADEAQWIDRLLNSEVYESQRALAGRGAPKPEDVRKFLAVLAERNGKTFKLTMAQQLGYPELRIAGIIAAMRRILNVDGYAVLDVEEASGTICLDLKLLKFQFGLPSGPDDTQ